MLVMEVLQFYVFLHHHQLPSNFIVPMQFSVRKAILNSVFPAKTGTVLFIHLITDNYELEWHNYIRFMVVATIIMLTISGLAAASIGLPLWVFLFVLASTILFSWGISRRLQESYIKQTPLLLLVGSGLYLCRIIIFWTVLMATGIDVGFIEASYFAIATNTLAQIPITPGNIGIREILFGFMAPYLSLPMSTGIFVGAIFQVLRILTYAVIMFVFDFLFGRTYQDNLATPKSG
jgi:uncharacterized membrane protein YbhN (UPF0104 family)